MPVCRYGELVGGTRAVLVARLAPLVKADQEKSADLAVDEKFWKYLFQRRFWAHLCRINVIANTTIVQFGKIGSNGQTQEKEHDSVEDAHKYADKQTNDKLKKGYAPVKGKGKRAAKAAAPAAAAPTVP